MTASPLRGGIRPLLFPRSVAVVGASDRTAEGAADLEQVLRGGVPTWFVNPNRPTALGRECFPALTALPEPPECALLLVGHTRAEAAFEDAIAAGVRAVVLPGLGAEAGAEGRAIATRIAARAAESDVAVVGPNCMGVATPGGVSLWIGTVGGPDTFVPGHVACVAHSGSIGEAFLACGGRVGFRTVVSAGSELSRDMADFVGYLAEDEGTRAIGLFVETIRRPDAFAAALARAAEAGKPVVCLKVGRSQAAARAALAHSGAVVGSARAFSALLRHHGALEVGDFHELVETLEVLGRRRWPRGLRIAAVSESGGECGLLADHGEDAGHALRALRLRARGAADRGLPQLHPAREPARLLGDRRGRARLPGNAEAACATRTPTTSCSRSSTSRAIAARTRRSGVRSSPRRSPTRSRARTSSLPSPRCMRPIRRPPSRSWHAPATWRCCAARARACGRSRPWRAGARAPAAASERATPPEGEPLPAGALPEHDSCALLERYGVEFAAARALRHSRRGGCGLRAPRRPGRREGRRAGAQAGRGRRRARASAARPR